MTLLKNLASASKEEVSEFINSFDHVLFDIDGCLLLGGIVVSTADTCVSKLRKLGKRIAAVTNNSILPPKNIEMLLAPFDIKWDRVVTPAMGILSYLKRVKFSRRLYVIGSTNFRESLKKEGFDIVDFGTENLEETMSAVMKHIGQIAATSNVGAVVLEMDINFTFAQAVQAIVLLKTYKDIELITGMKDISLPLAKEFTVLGSGFYIDAIESITQRTESITRFAKPSAKLADVANEKFHITDRSRVLFVGDSIESDMGFAHNAGYKKLLVLTGNTKEKDIINWQYPESHKPDYYIESVGDFGELLTKFNFA
ncbi:uncharacterized protein LOC132703747 [Cylas formicarius]|uniref:uncharacterized protein LOC132703747 n=1 Tax=Cylas formicarius TaxID=197179 RepID=UPI002958A65E|nr:uncharacterized protein LOC132703747 [Cylas formicarius]